MQGLLNAQEMAEARKVDILMGALAKELKQHVSVFLVTRCTTFFIYLESLYGDNIPVTVLRSQFFGCVQKPDELVKSQDNLQQQMLLGLQEGPLSQMLRAYVCHNPD